MGEDNDKEKEVKTIQSLAKLQVSQKVTKYNAIWQEAILHVLKKSQLATVRKGATLLHNKHSFSFL